MVEAAILHQTKRTGVVMTLTMNSILIELLDLQIKWRMMKNSRMTGMKMKMKRDLII